MVTLYIHIHHKSFSTSTDRNSY